MTTYISGNIKQYRLAMLPPDNHHSTYEKGAGEL